MKLMISLALAAALIVTVTAAPTCKTLEFDVTCCAPSKDQPENTYGALVMNYQCTNCKVFGNFNQTYVQNAGTFTSTTQGASASYVGAKSGGFATFHPTTMEGVEHYYYRSSDGKCSSTALMGNTGNTLFLSYCYENTVEDCLMG